ncbi:hypothetical protein A7A76_15205 [Lysobacter enzymogenes]|nr:hypothetical protein [Lysobacter enzymogenes]
MLALMAALASPAAFAAEPPASRTALIAGYQPDAKPMEAASVAAIFDLLRRRSGHVLGYRYDSASQHTTTVGFGNRPERWTFFLAGHWASPSVVRRRYERSGEVDRELIAYRCEAAATACARLAKSLAQLPPQHVYVPRAARLRPGEEIAVSAAVRRNAQPPPDKPVLSAADSPPRRPELVESDCLSDLRPLAPPDCPRQRLLAPQPKYPQRELVDRIAGTSTVVFKVDSRGMVTCAMIERSGGQPAFDAAALRLAQAMLFRREACRSGERIVRMRMPVAFDPSQREDDDTVFRRLTPGSTLPL